MLKIIVFGYNYFLKKEKKDKWFAWFRVSVFFVASCVLAQIVIVGNLLADIPLMNYWFTERHTLLSYLGFVFNTFPYFVLFYWLYPPDRLESYTAKFTYSTNYIWYVRLGLILYIIGWMLVSYLINLF